MKNDTIVRYKSGDRRDLVDKEQREIDLLGRISPESADELKLRISSPDGLKTKCNIRKDIDKLIPYSLVEIIVK
ncbi:GatB/YqeY domain-containing protein [Coxiella-like endosymbiont]|nr:GatB/YqeY domain-containing protein [Coxiella-like endosymbiont]